MHCSPTAVQLARAGAVLLTLTAIGLRPGSAQATDVIGFINFDQTWTAANSPYVLTVDEDPGPIGLALLLAVFIGTRRRRSHA